MSHAYLHNIHTSDFHPGAGLYLPQHEYDSLSDIILELVSQLVDEFGVRAEYVRLQEEELLHRVSEPQPVTMLGVEPFADSMDVDHVETLLDAPQETSDSEEESASSSSVASGSKAEDRLNFYEEWIADPRNPRDRPLGENAIYVHQVRWDTDRPRWAGKEIPEMPIGWILNYLQERFRVNMYKGMKCRLSGCPCPDRVFGTGGLKNHLKGQAHFHIRTHCLACGFESRSDNFDKRHKCTARRKAVYRALIHS